MDLFLLFLKLYGLNKIVIMSKTEYPFSLFMEGNLTKMQKKEEELFSEGNIKIFIHFNILKITIKLM